MGVRREEGDKDYWRGGMGRDVKSTPPPPSTPSFMHNCYMYVCVQEDTPVTYNSLWNNILRLFEIDWVW